MAIVDTEVGNSAERSDVGLLALRLSRVPRSIGYSRGEIANSVDLMVGQEEPCHLSKVQPPIRCAAQGSVVEIETVDV